MHSFITLYLRIQSYFYSTYSKRCLSMKYIDWIHRKKIQNWYECKKEDTQSVEKISSFKYWPALHKVIKVYNYVSYYASTLNSRSLWKWIIFWWINKEKFTLSPNHSRTCYKCVIPVWFQRIWVSQSRSNLYSPPHKHNHFIHFSSFHIVSKTYKGNFFAQSKIATTALKLTVLSEIGSQYLNTEPGAVKLIWVPDLSWLVTVWEELAHETVTDYWKKQTKSIRISSVLEE